MREEILRLEKITQITDGITLLDSLNLHIFKNEILGLLCLNDHGKETLIQLICRNIPLNFGKVYFLDSLANSYTRNRITDNSVLVIEKPLRLVDALSVADNIFILERRNRKVLNEQLKETIKSLDLHINTTDIIANLSSYEKCIVLLMKAYIMDVKLVILRDISNFLSTVELRKIHLLLNKLIEKKMTFLYICNNHEEALKICDRVALMENGRVIKILDKQNSDDEIMKYYNLNITHSLENEKTNNKDTKIVLRFENVFTDNISDLSFTINKGECVTFLDINNVALNDIIDLLNSSLRLTRGNIELEGINCKENKKLLKDSIEVLAEYPTQNMVFTELSYIDNLCFLLDKKMKGVWSGNKIKKGVMSEYYEYIGDDLFSIDIYNLSITSLYNLVYYRIHLLNPKIVICVQPFSGADMYLRHHIMFLLNKLLEKGITIIILAVNIFDTLSVSDRLFVLEKGRLKEEFPRKNFHKFRRDN